MRFIPNACFLIKLLEDCPVCSLLLFCLHVVLMHLCNGTLLLLLGRAAVLTLLCVLAQVHFDTTLKEMKAQVEILWLRGGSHGLKVKGRSEVSVMEEVNLKVISWIRNQAAQAP